VIFFALDWTMLKDGIVHMRIGAFLFTVSYFRSVRVANKINVRKEL